jgi:endonuclease-3
MKAAKPRHPKTTRASSALESPAPASSASASSAPRAARTAGAARRRKIVPLNAADVAEVFTRLRAQRPEPRSELEYADPYTLLVAVVLSAQATDLGVNKATKKLFEVADTPRKMVELGEDRLRDHIKTIGLFRGKARNVIALSRALLESWGGSVPHSREALEALPGVGRKTANVVLNVAFGEPLIAVDTHVFRVAGRLPLVIGKTPLDIELGLEKVVPAEFKPHAHHWLILHGRYVCKARRPECERCIVADICRFPAKTLPTGQTGGQTPERSV